MSKDWEGFESPHEHKVPAEALIWKHDCEVMGNGWNTWENGCRHCGKDKPKKQPTNMVTIPLDKLEDMQRRLKEQPTKEEILGKVFDAVYAQYPKKEWQGLSDDEISKVISDEQIPVRTGKTANRFAHAIEAKLKEKNNA